jgi:ribulose-bisphosphate carboxylase large chain
MFAAPEHDYGVMPVFSSGQWAEQAFETWARLQTADLIYAAGGGIVAHPGGIAAGVQSLRDAWQAAREGDTLPQAAQASPPLRQALDFFGTVRA